MAFSPFTYRSRSGHINEMLDVNGTPGLLEGNQPVPNPYPTQFFEATIKLALGIGATVGLGRHKFSSGKTGWDYMAKGARIVEEYSPGRVLRTFQVSHLLSPLETASQEYRYWSREMLLRMRSPGASIGQDVHSRYLDNLLGLNISYNDEILSSGIRYENGQLLTGKSGGKVLLEHAGIIRAPTPAGTRLQEGLLRSVKNGVVPNAQQVAEELIPFMDREGNLLADRHIIYGGKTRLRSAGRFISGYGTSLVERINQLARSPAELPVVSNIFNTLKKLPYLKKHLAFDVTPSSGLKTLGKITGKLGIAATFTYLSYKALDDSVRKSILLEGTLLDEGITAAAATLWTRGQRVVSSVAETLGGHAYREAQEDIAPGSTHLSTLAAFPLIGLFTGGGIGYAQNVARQARLHLRSGIDITEASLGREVYEQTFKKIIDPTYETTIRSTNKEVISLMEAEAQKTAAGWKGKVAKRIATWQQGKGIWGKVSKALGRVTPGRINSLLGTVVGAAIVAPFLPGALVPSDRPEELDALYSGQKEVEIRRGRWWEFGRSPYEGNVIDRYQKHWYPSMLARAKEKSIWGEDEPGPMKKWFLENFTYDLEKKHYQDRPYPITGTAFEDIPFIGPILGSTIGQWFKPTAYMHTEEWMKKGEDGGTKFVPQPPKFQEQTLPGELNKGAPISPISAKGVAGEEAYRMTEMVGLPGFTATSIKGSLTGEGDLFAQEGQLESARRMYGAEREYWDQELGGGLGTTELFRRLYPHRRRQIELYNPIRNTMPEWMPGPGERSPDFLHGDPFVKVQEGESRLPGVGYAALHPEVEGVKPEDYPTLHRFNILADIAPYSSKFDIAAGQMKERINSGEASKPEEERYHEVLRQVDARKKKRHFTPYKFRERANSPIEKILARENERQKGPENEHSFFAKVVGSYWETLTHNAETPMEMLTPASPASKLVHQRTAVEDYEKFQVHGTDSAFWEHPVRDFIKPFLSRSANALGMDSVPEVVQEKRNLEEYFDLLKYTKFTRLKRASEQEGEWVAAKEFEEKRRETLFGINPFTHNYSHILRALPRRERDYFSEFSKADMKERADILQMIPENEKSFYVSRWKLKDNEDMQKAVKKGLLSEKQIQVADEELQNLYEERNNEGMPKTKELWSEYVKDRMQGESYPDWYRRTKLMEKQLQGRALPGPDWVGWHPAVDLDDIKLKIVQDEGRNAFDYDLWPDRQRALVRRPIVAEGAESLKESLSPEQLRSRINEVMSASNIQATQVTLVQNGTGKNNIDVSIQEDRVEANKDLIRRSMANG